MSPSCTTCGGPFASAGPGPAVASIDTLHTTFENEAEAIPCLQAGLAAGTTIVAALANGEQRLLRLAGPLDEVLNTVTTPR